MVDLVERRVVIIAALAIASFAFLLGAYVQSYSMAIRSEVVHVIGDCFADVHLDDNGHINITDMPNDQWNNLYLRVAACTTGIAIADMEYALEDGGVILKGGTYLCVKHGACND